MKTVSFKTFGCRLNQAETAQFEAAFARAGFTRVPFKEPARVLVIHTCAVTRKAESEGLKFVRFARAQYPDTCLVLVGCAVEACGEETLHGLGPDLMIPHDRQDELVPRVLAHLKLDLPPKPLPPTHTSQRAILKVQDGCDFFCSYCIVPHTRGAPVSRPFDACLAEAAHFIDAGFQEIVVSGCNLGCYNDGGRLLTTLLSALLELPGLGRLRLGSLEPGIIERQVVDLMATHPRLCPFLHLSVQSGDTDVLKAMNRRYTANDLYETLRDIVAKVPHVGLGADVICGFPGETPEAFARTEALVRAFPFSNLHAFPYSERPHTPAAMLEQSVPTRERRRRTHDLIELGMAQRRAFAETFVGREVTVLAECFDTDGNGYGWSGEYLPCVVQGLPRDRIRKLSSFTVESTAEEALYGTWRSERS